MSDENKTLKIGFKMYKLEKPEEIITVGAEIIGTIDFLTNILKIANKFNQAQKNCTFIHEMLHGICEKSGLDELNDNEHAIDLLAVGIYEAIVDNPHIFSMQDI